MNIPNNGNTNFVSKSFQTNLPTSKSSLDDGFEDRKRDHISMVKIVDAELKIDVRDDIRAANITANMMPLKPENLWK